MLFGFVLRKRIPGTLLMRNARNRTAVIEKVRNSIKLCLNGSFAVGEIIGLAREPAHTFKMSSDAERNYC